MILSNKSVRLMVTLIIAALSGLIIVQVALLRNAMELKEEAFRDNVMSAMADISQSLASHEALVMAFLSDTSAFLNVQAEVTATVDSRRLPQAQVGKLKTVLKRDNLSEEAVSMFSEDGTIKYTVQSPQHVVMKIIDPATGSDTTLVDNFQQAGEYEIEMDKTKIAPGSFIWRYSTQSDSTTIMVEDLDLPSTVSVRSDSAKRKLVARVFKGLLQAETEPIEKRLDSLNVDSIISHNLKESGIDLEYAYGVLNDGDDSLHIAQPEQYRQELKASSYRLPLFQQDIFSATSSLALYFPDHRAFIWGQLSPLLVATVLFMFVITGLFVYSIRTILGQRRMSELLVDFINNMTHEFRTPISTIALATEAIERPDIIKNHDKVQHFNKMIKSENQRMRNQTDKILQMAALEEGGLDLNLTSVDIHQVIKEATNAVRLHINARKGNLGIDLQATKHTIKADIVHLSNIIHNLLDNANKYSPEAPEITLRTFDSDFGVGVRIEDHGLGIKTEDQKQVFDKYFRVPSGNLHDVKGFGLGLSYVKQMVNAHKGKIQLTSKLGEGTEIELFFPLFSPLSDKQT